MARVCKMKYRNGLIPFWGAILLTILLAGQGFSIKLDTLIQPGQGVGVLKLGETIEQSYQKLGKKKADAAENVVYGKEKGKEKKEVWFSYWDMGLTLVYSNEGNDKGKLIRIIVSSKGLPVERTGLRVGSPLTDLERYYPKPESPKEMGGGRELWEYSDQGISFTVNRVERRVDVITVMPKEGSKR